MRLYKTQYEWSIDREPGLVCKGPWNKIPSSTLVQQSNNVVLWTHFPLFMSPFFRDSYCCIRFGIAHAQKTVLVVKNTCICSIRKTILPKFFVHLFIWIFALSPRAVVLGLEFGLETFFYRLGLVLYSLVFGLGLVSDLVIGLAKCSSWSRPSPAIYAFFFSFKTKPLI